MAFVSRNPAVVVVDASGLISALGLGTTYVIVGLPIDGSTLQDSVSVGVGTRLGTRTDIRH